MKKALLVLTFGLFGIRPAFAKYECVFAVDEGAQVIPYVTTPQKPNAAVKYLQRGRVGRYEVSLYIQLGRKHLVAKLNGVEVAATSTDVKGRELELSFGAETVQCEETSY